MMFARNQGVMAGVVLMLATPLAAQGKRIDFEMAHVAVTASLIDIRYAHLGIALSENPEVTAQDNAIIRSLLAGAARKVDELSRLRGPEFDRAYTKNESAYLVSVNGVVK
jgi:putative membrane protein